MTPITSERTFHERTFHQIIRTKTEEPIRHKYVFIITRYHHTKEKKGTNQTSPLNYKNAEITKNAQTYEQKEAKKESECPSNQVRSDLIHFKDKQGHHKIYKRRTRINRCYNIISSYPTVIQSVSNRSPSFLAHPSLLPGIITRHITLHNKVKRGQHFIQITTTLHWRTTTRTTREITQYNVRRVRRITGHKPHHYTAEDIRPKKQEQERVTTTNSNEHHKK